MSANSGNVSRLLKLAEDPSLVGRTFQVVEKSGVYIGPIAKVSLEDKTTLVITVEWLALSIPQRSANPWSLTDDWPTSFSVPDDFGKARLNSDGSVYIHGGMSWNGTILPSTSPPLRKPER